MFLPFFIIVSTNNQKQETRSSASDLTIDSLNTEALENNRSGKSIINQAILERRKVQMEELAYSNPSEFLNKAMNVDIRNSFPEDQQNLIEETQDISGKLLIYHSDNLKDDIAKQGYLIQNNQRTYKFIPTSEISEEFAHSGNSITVKGYKLDNIVVASDQNVNIQQDNPSISSLDTKRYLVLPVNFTDDRSRPYTLEQIVNRLFGEDNSLRKYYQDQSNGKIFITGVVYPWNKLDFSKSTVCDHGDKLIDFAQNRYGDHLNTYKGVIFVFPNLETCYWAGMSTFGGSPSFSWINNFDLATYSHEIGHSLGINHASLAKCKDETCKYNEYGDKSDTMGYNTASLNAIHLFSLNVLDNSKIKSISEDGVYSLNKLGNKNGPQVLLILNNYLDPYDNVYLEYRAEKGQYGSRTPYPLSNGILIYRWNGKHDGNTRLIDTTPGDGSRNNLVLQDGDKFNIGNVTIKQISHTSNYAMIEITKK